MWLLLQQYHKVMQ